MSKTCVACGFAVPDVEQPVPPSPTGHVEEPAEQNKCPNCGKDMNEVPDLPSGEEEQE
jgi:hypothetical protein